MRRLRAIDGSTELGSGSSEWRRHRLLRAGMPPELAGTVARDPRFDVHALLELVDRGCEPELAARIVAPLEETGE